MTVQLSGIGFHLWTIFSLTHLGFMDKNNNLLFRDLKEVGQAMLGSGFFCENWIMNDIKLMVQRKERRQLQNRTKIQYLTNDRRIMYSGACRKTPGSFFQNLFCLHELIPFTCLLSTLQMLLLVHRWLKKMVEIIHEKQLSQNVL